MRVVCLWTEQNREQMTCENYKEVIKVQAKQPLFSAANTYKDTASWQRS